MPRGVYKRKPRPPRYRVGQRIHKIVLEEYVGRLVIGERNHRPLYDHVYKGRCDCGNYRMCSQRYLAPKKHMPMCEECAKKQIEKGRSRAGNKRAERHKPDGIDVLSVHSMRW